MTQVFGEDGKVYPATVVFAGPVTVLQVRTKEKDGYEAVQVGYGEKNEKKITKPLKGHFKDLGNFATIKEFRGPTGEIKRGDVFDVSIFEPGDVVAVSAVSKGKGFQGVVKRHGFAGGRRSHGNKHHERAPGSIGATGPQRVFKGQKMAGRMGGEKVTVKNLKILQVDKEIGALVISGAIPGPKGALVEIKTIK